MNNVTIRPAALEDIPDLIRIENSSFDLDILSRRNFRHILSRGHATTLIAEYEGRPAGYVMVLFNRGTSVARLYSVAVMPEARGKGIGLALAEAAEDAAIENGYAYLRLEVHQNNRASRELFARLGYQQFGIYTDYYEDHADALRFEKALTDDRPPLLARVPYYRQTLEFTCGPACLMMAMAALDNTLEFSRHLELRLWREATSIFMTSGHGGCGPFGLALAAFHRGFSVEVYASEADELFVGSVRSEEKKEVIKLVNEDFLEEIRIKGIPLHNSRLNTDDMEEKLKAGGIPIVLISSFRIYKEKFPHWVVVTGMDERFIYIHEPYVDVDSGKTITVCVNLPIARRDFERMARYGRSSLRTAVILNRKD
ncbi:MAG: GNAT family N-acetyltransferase/peptidase C39 family protein [Desulfobulbaceae bacterium]|nr:GNAT family N-acetyltransferase/peptidase C39 family protein [Desulfobulbaceae bacterium]